MADFVIEKNVPLKKTWRLPEYMKNLVEQLELDESFSFPIVHYLVIKRYANKYQKGKNKKFSLRRISEDKARIWRIV